MAIVNKSKTQKQKQYFSQIIKTLLQLISLIFPKHHGKYGQDFYIYVHAYDCAQLTTFVKIISEKECVTVKCLIEYEQIFSNMYNKETSTFYCHSYKAITY